MVQWALSVLYARVLQQLAVIAYVAFFSMLSRI